MRKLSTLELTVLGLAWLRGPCTIYAIMKELSMSQSSFYKSRAGTAYSIANRLLRLNLLTHAEGENLVKVSDEGVEALQAWLKPPIPLPDVAHSADLIRLRFFFLGVVDQAERLSFIDDSIAGLEVFLGKCQDLISANEEIGDYFGALATVSTILETQARIRWLRLVREWVVHPIGPRGSWSETILNRCAEPPPGA